MDIPNWRFLAPIMIAFATEGFWDCVFDKLSGWGVSLRARRRLPINASGGQRTARPTSFATLVFQLHNPKGFKELLL
jgi:hypothetical protein